MPADIIWTLVAFFLTVFVLSYALGDNPLFRMAIYLFVGVAAGYVAVLIIYQVLLSKLVTPILTAPLDQKLLTAVPLLLSFLLIFKLSPRLARLGNVPMAFIVGVGAAVAIGGVVTGTLFGQMSGAIAPFDISPDKGHALSQLTGGIVLLIGSISSLTYFSFGATREKPTGGRPKGIETLAKIGQVFIAITLGALFAGVLVAALTALIERLDFIIKFIQSFFV